ncbi:1-acyl-sn-glycerol-3-phosphate acyltransferase [Candidatus Kaiserbacteria bacterium]|nr:1-acyl-sn-glycerol-3-phosphate acyltransferase [Candidatus Kaiserbacteria bacterium]
MIQRIGKRIGSIAVNGYFATTQFATTPLDWWLSRRIGLSVSMPSGLYVPSGTLVLANHRSLLDAFLVTFHLGRQNWLTAIPARCPLTSAYARRPILGPILKMFGAYDIGNTSIERAKKLLFTRDLLDRKHTVILFPEGKIVEKGVVVDEFQQGAQMLFAHDYPTLFVRLSGFDTRSFIHPKTVTNARMVYSDIIRGDAATKLERLREFFGAEAA